MTNYRVSEVRVMSCECHDYAAAEEECGDREAFPECPCPKNKMMMRPRRKSAFHRPWRHVGSLEQCLSTLSDWHTKYHGSAAFVHQVVCNRPKQRRRYRVPMYEKHLFAISWTLLVYPHHAVGRSHITTTGKEIRRVWQCRGLFGSEHGK